MAATAAAAAGALLLLAGSAPAGRSPLQQPGSTLVLPPLLPVGMMTGTHPGHAPAAAAATGPALWPLTPPTAATLALVFAICVLAASSGIGGGAALVPVFLTAGGFGRAPAHAVALSNLAILGASVTAFAVNVTRRRPGPPGGPARPLIDWRVALLMEPATIAGAVAGAFLNRVLPPWLTLCGLAAVLVCVTHNVAGRARAQWRAEGGAAGLRSGRPEVPPRGGVADDGSLAARLVVVEEGEEEADGVGPSSAADPPLIPAGKCAALFALFLVVAASDFFKARVVCGSPAYWLAVLGVVPPALAVTAYARADALAHAASHAVDGGDDLAWTPGRTLLFPAVSSLAGLFAGLFGVGGGILKAPLLLSLGVDPAVAAATSATMILFTSASASTVYLGWGTPVDWSGAVLGIGAAASAVGVLGLARVVAASGGRRSLVTIAMAATLGVSLLASGWEAGVATAAAARAGELGKHGSVCLRV